MLALRTLVFPTDDSARADAARPFADVLARRHGATLHVLRVEVLPVEVDLWTGAGPATLPEPSAAVQGVLNVHRRALRADDAIVDYAEDVGADLIVMGTHGRHGIGRALLGSTAEGVLRRAACPVLTVGPDTGTPTGPVLVPLSFESASEVALETAAAWAEAEGRPLVALHVVEPMPFPVPYAMTYGPFDPGDAVPRVQQTLDRWVATHASGTGPVQTEVRRGAPAAEILAAARDHGAAWIVQASHGRRGLGRWMLGSVAEEVARHAPCPVLTVRGTTRRLTAPDSDEAPTQAVPRPEWPALFDALSARAHRTPHTVEVNVRSPETTGTVYAGAALVGLTYDPHDDAVEVLVEGGSHHAVRPFAVLATAGAWTLDTAHDAAAPGPWVLDVVRADGAREQITIRAAAPPPSMPAA